MIIKDILSSEEVTLVCKTLAHTEFVSGHESAGAASRSIKNNMQTKGQVPVISKLVDERLRTNKLFHRYARPMAVTFRFSRYDDGMYYGSHIDAALTEGFRSDVAFTLFLSEPDNYDGGELVIEGDEDRQTKLPPGSLFVYPATSFHRVETVTRGIRFAAVGWVMSFVRDAAQREILADLEFVRELLSQDSKSHEFRLVAKSLANLTRAWTRN